MDFDENELDNLGEYKDRSDDNILDKLPTLLPFHSSYAALHEANSTIEQQQPDLVSFIYETLQTENIEELVASPTAAVHNLVGPVETTENNQVQTTEPVTFDQGTYFNWENPVGPTLVHDEPSLPPLPESLPNFSDPLLNETQLGHSLLSEAGLILEGAVPSIQDQDMTQMGSFNQFSQMLNESLQTPQHNQFPAPSVYDSQYALNRMQSPQWFTTQLNQVDQANGLQNAFDVYPMNSSGKSNGVLIQQQVQQVAPDSTNGVLTQSDKGKIPESSSTRGQLSEAMLRILNMNPGRKVTSSSYSPNPRQSRNLSLPVYYERPRLGRPPKRREAGESSSRGGKKGSSGTGKAGNLNANPTNSSLALSDSLSVYDPTYEKNGVPIDPHFRLFKARPTKK